MNKFRCKNLLVTGGCGFIGSNFIEYLLNKYDKLFILNLDLLTYAGDINNTKNFDSNKRYKFIKGNICDQVLLEKLFTIYKIDGVINFAAESHVDNSITNPDIFIKTNIQGVFCLLKICKKFWMNDNFITKPGYQNARFHQISTDEVYGSIDEGSFTEESNISPNSPYSASKASADLIVRSFDKTYGLNTVISRSSNNFGSNQNIEKFIPKVINSINNETNIYVYGDGKNIRDWMSVEDHSTAIEIIFNNAIKGSIYNIGANNEKTNLEIISIIGELMNKKIQAKRLIKFVKDRPGHDKRYSLNIDKIIKDFNWRINCNFNDSLLKIIKKIKF